MILLLIIGGTLIVRWRHTPGLVAVYALVPAVSLLAFSLLFQWQVFGSRYLLPFFCLSAPLAGLIMGSMRRWHSGMLVSGLLVVACLPWLFGIRTRPLLAAQEGGGLVSVLAEPRTQLMFANGPYLEKPYTDMAGCDPRSGLQVGGIDVGRRSGGVPVVGPPGRAGGEPRN